MQLGHENQAFIETMTEKDFYKYLGVLQLRGSSTNCSERESFGNLSQTLVLNFEN